jgi:hypothetical protein
MTLAERKAELAEQHLRLSVDHARISALARRHPDRASIYDRVLSRIQRDLAIVAARLALLDDPSIHRDPSSPNRARARR